jgi:hypothetical protein
LISDSIPTFSTDGTIKPLGTRNQRRAEPSRLSRDDFELEDDE